MAIDWNDEIVDQLQWHWQRQLRPRLDGLTDDDYFRQPLPVIHHGAEICLLRDLYREKLR